MSDTVVDTFNEVVVIGGGPAGSSTANLLAQAGCDVLVLEAVPFPRWHIGESLLPIDLPIFEQLGIAPAKLGHLTKRGAIFVDERVGKQARFAFDRALPGTPSHAFQVDRAQFDHELLLRAREVGAKVIEGEKVHAVEISGTEVRLSTSAGLRRAKYLIDASGQNAFLARHFRSAQPIEEFGQSAVLRRYSALNPAVQAELYEQGDIRVLLIDGGWCWVIPLAGGELSVGMVNAKGRADAAFYEHNFAASPLLQRMTAGATMSPYGYQGNYSYRNLAPYGQRYACIGDSATFLDPIFSSGVTLALLSAERCAKLLAPALAQGREDDPALMLPLKEHMATAYLTFERMIYRFYHTNLVHNLFFGGSPDPEIYAGITSVLAGDVWRDDNPFAKMLLGRARG